MTIRLCAFALSIAALTASGCGAADTDYTIKYAPDFQRKGPTVSIFGVYRDGRMSTEAWNELAPRFASTFGGGAACEVVYGETLLAEDSALAGAVDDVARSDGVTDELAGLFAPAATADEIAIVSVTGLPSKPAGGLKRPMATTPATPMRGGGGRRGNASQYGGANPTSSHVAGEGESRDAFELSVSLYSVKENRTVGVVAMKYTGKDVDGSVVAFFEKLRAELPNAKCRGWKHDVKVDAERVRALQGH